MGLMNKAERNIVDPIERQHTGIFETNLLFPKIS
jgi:hypothetical protein